MNTGMVNCKYFKRYTLYTHFFFNPFRGGPLSKDEDFLHVVTANPILLLSMPLSGDSFHYLDLDDFFPSTRSLWNPQLTLAALGELHAGKVLLHDAYVSSSNILKVGHACSVRIYKNILFLERMGDHCLLCLPP